MKIKKPSKEWLASLKRSDRAVLLTRGPDSLDARFVFFDKRTDDRLIFDEFIPTAIKLGLDGYSEFGSWRYIVQPESKVDAKFIEQATFHYYKQMMFDLQWFGTHAERVKAVEAIGWQNQKPHMHRKPKQKSAKGKKA